MKKFLPSAARNLSHAELTRKAQEAIDLFQQDVIAERNTISELDTYLRMFLKIVSTHPHNFLFDGLSQDKLLEFVHGMYGASRGYYVASLPKPQDIYLSIADITGSFEDKQIDKFLLKPITMALIYHHNKGQPKSLSSSQWLIDNISELKTGKVLEIASGYGERASQLADLGVDIIATDLRAAQIPYSASVEPIGAVSAIKKYNDRNVIIIENPVWNPLWFGNRIVEESTVESMRIIPHIDTAKDTTIILVMRESQNLDFIIHTLQSSYWLPPSAQNDKNWSWNQYNALAENYKPLEVLKPPSELFQQLTLEKKTLFHDTRVLVLRFSPSSCNANRECLM